MALASTTLSSAVVVTDNTIVVASATSVAAGRIVLIDNEYMQVAQTYTSGTTVPVLRGRDGSVTAAHASSANVTHGLASDFALPPTGVSASVTTSPTVSFTKASYSAAGAIAFGAAMWTTAIINGTSALAMTLANPTKDQDGIILAIVSNGKGAHTVTYTAGLGNAGSSYDVVTYTTSAQQSLVVIAANGIWVQFQSPMSGTLTSLQTAIA